MNNCNVQLMDDLPDEVALRVIRIFPDNCSAYMWDLNGCCQDVQVLGCTDALDKKFCEWADFWDRCVDTKNNRVDADQLSAANFDEHGLELCLELKKSIEPGIRIIYFCTMIPDTFEIAADGTIISLPRTTNFREWALAHP